MADELNTPVVTPEAPAAPTVAVEAPITETPVQATPTPEAAPAAPVEAVAAQLTEAPKSDTILGEAIEQAQEKPAEAALEAKKTEEAPKATDEPKLEGQSEEPAPPPVYDAWTLPEGLSLDEQMSKEFTDILANFELENKADHAKAQEFGQKLVDFHVSEQKKLAENLQNFYQTNWEKQKTQWKEEFLKDPEIGGNRSQTTVDAALNFIRTHGGTPEQQAEFKTLMDTSGLGNHPAMIRLLANASRVLSEGQPLAAQRPVQATKSKISTMYGK